MGKTKSKEIVTKDDIGSALTNIYDATSIEILGEEEFVYNSLVKGIDRKNIVKELNRKHSDYSGRVTVKDIENFLIRNPKIAKDLIKESDALVNRQAEVYLNHNLALAQMFDKVTESLKSIEEHPQYDIRRDGYLLKEYIKMATDIIQNDAKIRGIGGNNKQVNIFKMDAEKIVNNAMSNPTDLQKRILERLNEIDNKDDDNVEPIDAEFTVNEND